MSGSGSITGDEIPFAPPERFELKRKLGAGGMGVVYEAWDRENGVRVALKTGRTREADALVRFKSEFRSLAEVVHDNLVGLYEMISTEDQWFFSMEYVEGVDFLSYVRGPQTSGGGEEAATATVETPSATSHGHLRIAPPLNAPEQFDRLRQALLQVVRGLDHLHSLGKLHCDIKPSNVHVRTDGRVAILDFGLVYDTAFHPLWKKRQVAGTRGYMSPEQSRAELLSPAADWYSLGVMVFEAIHGHVATDSGNAARTGVPEDLREICAGLLELDPTRRFSGAVLLEKLGAKQSANPQHERTIRLIGREDEMAALEDKFHQTIGGQPAIVFLHGSSGMGKSELSRQFAARASESRATVSITGRCYEQESVPFKAVDGVADMLGAFLKSLDAATAAACEPRDSAALARIFPVLTHHAFSGVNRNVDMDPVELRRRAFRAFRDLLARLGDRKQLVLIIDDLQWGDLDSAALLRELLRPPDPPVLMLILCYRTEDQDSPCVAALRAADLPGTTEIQLRPFEREKALRLAGGLLNHSDPNWRARAEAIADECGGSPYLAVELAQHGAGPAHNSSLDDVLWRRVGKLSPEARQVLEIVAVAGRSISRKDAFTAAGLQAQDPAIISQLRGNRLVRATGAGEDSVETYHDRIRETVNSRISKTRLKECHRSVALALEGSRTAEADQLAFHFDNGGEPERALLHYVRGGDLAARALAFDRAAQLYSRSLGLLSEGVRAEDISRRAILISLADSYANSGRGHDAARNYELAAAGTSDTVEALSMRQRAAYQYCISGYLDEGREVFRDVLNAVGQRLPPQGLRIVPLLLWSGLRMRFAKLDGRERRGSRSDNSRADALWAAATGFGMVDLVGGAYFADRAALEALRCGDPQRTLRALAWRACVIANRGRHSEPEVNKLLAACRQILDRHTSEYGEGMMEMAKGLANFHLDRKIIGLEHLLAAEDHFVSKCPGTYWERTTTRFFICFCLANQGRMAELRRRVDVILRDSKERGDRFTYAFVATGFAYRAALAEDRPEEARGIVAEAIDSWRQPGVTSPKIYAMWARSAVYCYTEEWTLMEEDLERTLVEARGSMLLRIQAFRLSFLVIRARVALGLAGAGVRTAANLVIAERESRALLSMDNIIAKGFGLGLRAAVQGFRNDRQGAIESLRKAIQTLERDDFVYLMTTMRLILGQITSGDDGLRMEREAFQWLRTNGVAAPYRSAYAASPPLPGLVLRPPLGP